MYIGRTNNYGFINLNNKKNTNNSFQKDKDKSTNYILSKDNESLDENQKKALKEVENLKEELKNSEASLKATREAYDVQLRCSIIASRIMSGNKVPKSDYLYLAKNDPDLYEKAIILRQERENPTKHKRLSPDEKDSSLDVESLDMENLAETEDIKEINT